MEKHKVGRFLWHISKKYGFYLLILLVLLLAIGNGIWITRGREGASTWIERGDISMILHTERSQMGGQDVCVVSRQGRKENRDDKDNTTISIDLIGSNLVFHNSQYKEEQVYVLSDRDSYRIRNLEYDEISTYDVDTLQLIGKLDAKAMVDNVLAENPDSFFERLFLSKRGYLVIELNKIAESRSANQYYYYDIITGEFKGNDIDEAAKEAITLEEKETAEDYEDSLFELEGQIRQGQAGKLNQIQQLETFWCYATSLVPGICRISIDCKELPVHGKELYKRFPGLQTYQGQEENTANFYFYGYQKQEDILRLFLEDEAGLQDELGGDR